MQMEMIIKVESRLWTVKYKYMRNNFKLFLINPLSQCYFYL